MSRGLPAEPSPRTRQRLEAFCGLIAGLVPGLLAAGRARSGLDWQRDLAAVRELGFVPVGGEGALSAALAQLALLVPLGGRVMRLSLIGIVASMVAGYCGYRIAGRLAESSGLSSRLVPVFAAAAALLVTATPAWQLEAASAGGAVPAATLVLATWLGQGRLPPIALGMMFGATLAEDRLCGVLLAVMAFGLTLGQRRMPRRRDALELALGVVLALALLLGPMVIWRGGASRWLEFGTTFDAPPVPASAGLDPWRWLVEIGPFQSAVALLGAAVLARGAGSRPLAFSLLVALAFDLVTPGVAEPALTADRGMGVQLVAAAAVACFAAVGALWLVLWLRRSGLPYARSARALVVVLVLTGVLVTVDDSGYVLAGKSSRAVQVWTEEAVSSLPPNSLMLVRSEPVAWRLWAAALAQGERPDVIVVPLPLVGAGDVPGRLLEREPALAPLVRELIVGGRPTELALSTLSDARPVYVEFDPSWDPRLLGHLLPDGLWLRFVAHDLGQSDRAASLGSGRSALERVVQSAADSTRPDPATLTVIGDRAREQLAVVAALGDRAAALVLEAELGRILPGDQVLAEIQARLARSRRRDLSLIRLLE